MPARGTLPSQGRGEAEVSPERAEGLELLRGCLSWEGLPETPQVHWQLVPKWLDLGPHVGDIGW